MGYGSTVHGYLLRQVFRRHILLRSTRQLWILSSDSIHHPMRAMSLVCFYNINRDFAIHVCAAEVAAAKPSASPSASGPSPDAREHGIAKLVLAIDALCSSLSCWSRLEPSLSAGVTSICLSSCGLVEFTRFDVSKLFHCTYYVLIPARSAII
jgi:hypothetical protein